MEPDKVPTAPDYKKLIAENEAHPPKTLQQHTADLLRLVAEERERITAMGTREQAGVILAKEADLRDAGYRKSCEDEGRKLDALRVEAWKKAIADRDAALAATSTAAIDARAEAERVYAEAMARIEEKRLTDPVDYAQGAATLELRKRQQARRDDIALHEQRRAHADGEPGRY